MSVPAISRLTEAGPSQELTTHVGRFGIFWSCFFDTSATICRHSHEGWENPQ